MNQYVRLTFRDAIGRKRTVWAEKLRPGCYRKVNKEGEWGLRGSVTYIVLGEGDLVSEKPARINPKYGELELE